MFNSLGIVSMSKKMFWTIFRSAWQKAFTSQNIAFEFFKRGIFFLNPFFVLDKIIKKATSLVETENIQVFTFMNSRAVRRVHKAYAKHPTSLLLKKILHVNERLTVEHSTDQHLIHGLIDALKQKKRRRKRGVRLNLIEEKEEGAQFFSPSKMQAARNFQASKKEEKSKKQKKIAEKRTQSIINKVQKEKRS